MSIRPGLIMGILPTSQEGHVEVVKALLAQPNINVNQARTDLEWKGISLLWIASFNRYAEGCIISPGLIDIDAWVHKKNLHHFKKSFYGCNIEGNSPICKSEPDWKIGGGL